MVDTKEVLAKVDPRVYARQFREFLMKTNMLALALGVVIGNATSDVVNSIVKDIFGVVFDVLVPRKGWEALTWHVWHFEFRIGSFGSKLVTFVIVAGVVFLITKAFIRSAPPPPSKTCPACKEGIHPESTRCKFCTSEVPLVIPPPPPPPAPEAPKPA